MGAGVLLSAGALERAGRSGHAPARVPRWARAHGAVCVLTGIATPRQRASRVSVIDVCPWTFAHTRVCVCAGVCVSECLCAHVWVLSICL